MAWFPGCSAATSSPPPGAARDGPVVAPAARRRGRGEPPPPRHPRPGKGRSAEPEDGRARARTPSLRSGSAAAGAPRQRSRPHAADGKPKSPRSGADPQRGAASESPDIAARQQRRRAGSGKANFAAPPPPSAPARRAKSPGKGGARVARRGSGGAPPSSARSTQQDRWSDGGDATSLGRRSTTSAQGRRSSGGANRRVQGAAPATVPAARTGPAVQKARRVSPPNVAKIPSVPIAAVQPQGSPAARIPGGSDPNRSGPITDGRRDTGAATDRPSRRRRRHSLVRVPTYGEGGPGPDCSPPPSPGTASIRRVTRDAEVTRQFMDELQLDSPRTIISPDTAPPCERSPTGVVSPGLGSSAATIGMHSQFAQSCNANMIQSDQFQDNYGITPADLNVSATQIARGHFGIVYQGDYQATAVAVKVLLADAKSPSRLREWREEVAQLSRLRHPNVLQMLGAVFDPGAGLAIVTELCAEGTVRKAVWDAAYGCASSWMKRVLAQRDGSSSVPLWGTKLDWLLQVAKGMAFLHYKKVFHRDLKASNVLLSNGIAKVTGFGMSAARRDAEVASRLRPRGQSLSPLRSSILIDHTTLRSSFVTAMDTPLSPAVGLPTPRDGAVHRSATPRRAAAAGACADDSPAGERKSPRESPRRQPSPERHCTRRRRHAASGGRNDRPGSPDPAHQQQEGQEESGTFAYVAPECWPGLPTSRGYTTAGDVYSFGVMLVEVTAAKVPFDDVAQEEEARVARAIAGGRSRPRMPGAVGKTRVPDAIRDLSAQCCAYKAASRPTFRELIDALTEEVRHGEYRFQESAVPFAADEQGVEERVEEFDPGALAGGSPAPDPVRDSLPRHGTDPAPPCTPLSPGPGGTGLSGSTVPLAASSMRRQVHGQA